MRVYIVYEDNETAWLRGQGPCRDQAVFRVDPVDPDNRIPRMYLGMERTTAGISNQSTLLELKDVHEKPLSSFNVLVYSQRNDAMGTPLRSVFLDPGSTQFGRGSIRVWET